MRTFFLLSLFIGSLSAPMWAQPVQDDLPQITGCIALVNANVVTAPGKSPVTSNVVFRDGLIVQAGPSIRIPPDAYRIQADSLYVYPAFIDAFSSIGIKSQDNEREGGGQGGPGGNRGQRPAVDAEGNASLVDAGITPFNSVRATFEPKEKSITDWRAQGFAISHVVPKGKMIPGKGAIVVLSGKETDAVLWREDISMFGQWTGSGNTYPATVIGVMAKWRELYTNATHFVKHKSAYEQAPLVSRPSYSQAHEALMPVVRKEMPLYFRAAKVKDISRALDMKKELGMHMIIADAEEAWYLKDQFRSGTIPLILSLDLPDDKSSDTKSKRGPEGPGQDGPGQPGPDVAKSESKAAEGDPQKPAADSVKVDAEKAAFDKRRAESLKAHREQAGMLAREGIAFSFGTMSVKPGDFSKNIQVMMEHGLSFDKALASLTTQPAKLLGIDKYCGTLEVGKMANAIVTDKPLFEKETAIRYMIVEGSLFEYEAKEKKKDKPGGSASSATVLKALEGKWSYTIETPDQARNGHFNFSDGNGVLSGTISNDDISSGDGELDGIVLDGKSVSFTYDFDMGGQMMTLEFDLTLDGDSMEGNVTVGQFGTFPVIGRRISKPNY